VLKLGTHFGFKHRGKGNLRHILLLSFGNTDFNREVPVVTRVKDIFLGVVLGFGFLKKVYIY